MQAEQEQRMQNVAESTSQDYDVLIVGGGMVGAALALALVDSPLRILVLEQQPVDTFMAALTPAETVHDFEPRVSALTEASRRLLQRVGGWPDHPRMQPYQRMCVWDGDGSGEIVFEAAEIHQRNLGHIVENRLIQSTLAQRLADDPRITLLTGLSLQGWRHESGWRCLRLSSGESIRARLVVGADGAHSRIRQLSGLPTREWDYAQQALVCSVRTERPHQRTAWQRFSPSGPLAFLPLANEQGDDHYCSIVWSQDSAEAECLMLLDDAAFALALATALEHRLGRVEAVSRRLAIPLRQRHAKDYVATGVALVGDAAHTIHPLAGQGVNLGFADAAVLAEELIRAVARGLPVDDPSVLQRYQRRRKGDNLAMMAAMEAFKQLFARDEPVLRWVRNAGMRWLDRQPLLKRRIISEAMGL